MTSRSLENWCDKLQPSLIDALNKLEDLDAHDTGLNAHTRKAASCSEKLEAVSEIVLPRQSSERGQRASGEIQTPDPKPSREGRSVPLSDQETGAVTLQNEMCETSGAIRDFAEALVSLRSARRHNVEELEGPTGSAAQSADPARHLVGQLEALQAPLEKTNPCELRSQLDELRMMLNELSREDSMRRMESRRDCSGEQTSDLDSAESLREDLAAPPSQLDRIRALMSQLTSAPSLQAARESAAADTEIVGQLVMIDKRLDEVIRAIVASSTPHSIGDGAPVIGHPQRQPDTVADGVPQSAALDAETMRQLENGLQAVLTQTSQVDASNIRQLKRCLEADADSLADCLPTVAPDVQDPPDRFEAVVDHPGRQLSLEAEPSHQPEARSPQAEELAGSQPCDVLLDRLDHLSQLLEDDPAAANPQLNGQLEKIAELVGVLDLDIVNEHLSDRLKALSLRIDAATGDVAATDNHKDMLPECVEDPAESATRRQPANPGSPEACPADNANQIDSTPERVIATDGSIRDLESRVAGLSKLLASSNVTGASAPDREPRNAAIEDRVASGRAASRAIETAGQQAEAAIASCQQAGMPAADLSAIESLVGGLRALEGLSSQRDDSDAAIPDAVRDALLEIAGRLDRLENAATGRPSGDGGRADDPLLSGLMQRLTGSYEKKMPAGGKVPHDIGPETVSRPPEPGPGAPDVIPGMAKMGGARSPAHEDGSSGAEGRQAGSDNAHLVAAARRAALAAVAELERNKKKPGFLRQALKMRRRPMLLAAAALLLALLSHALVYGLATRVAMAAG